MARHRKKHAKQAKSHASRPSAGVSSPSAHSSPLSPPQLPPQGSPTEAEDLQEVESWLDWGIEQAKEWGPLLLEVVPELLALL